MTQISVNTPADVAVTPLDSNGRPTALPANTSVVEYTASDPSIVITPHPDGLSCTIVGSQPVQQASISVRTALQTGPQAGTAIMGTSMAFNIVAVPAPQPAVTFGVTVLLPAPAVTLDDIDADLLAIRARLSV